MRSSTPICTTTTPRKCVRPQELRLRGIPSHIADALSKLESSVASTSDNSDAQSNTPTTNITFTTRIYSLTMRLLEFVKDAENTQEENVALRKSLQETKQKSEEKEDGYLREITKMKIVVDETNTQLQNLRNDLEAANANAETLRERTVELERDNISLQRQCQNAEVQSQNLTGNLQKALLEKKEIKESRDVMEVELASERNRNNILANELQETLQQIERSKTQQHEASGMAMPQECLSCVKRFGVEEKLKQKIQCLENELQVSKKDAAESEKKLQALAEELRVRVLEEKVRAQKLARKNSQLAAERVNAAQQLSAFEEVLNKAHSKTFHGDAHEESQLNEGMLHGDETVRREMLIMRRLGVRIDPDGSLTGPLHQNGEPMGDCQMM